MTTYNRICINCGKEFNTNNKSAKSCCIECGKEYCQKQIRQKRSDKLKETGKEGYDYIICPVCNMCVGEITLRHVQMHGFNTIEEFLKNYGMKTCKCQKGIDRVKGDKNPGYQHGGKLSPFSKNSMFSEEQISAAKKKAVANRTAEKRTVNKEYWIAKGFSETEAIQKVHERQTTFSKEICIEKYGEEEGLKRWQQRQEKWQHTLDMLPEEEKLKITREKVEKSNSPKYSRIATECLTEVETKFGKPLNIGKKEKTVRIGNTFIKIDACYEHKCIEFFGDYFHAYPEKYSPTDVVGKGRHKTTAEEVWKKDASRLKSLKEKGYVVKVIWEHEYRKNKSKVIQECLQFLQE